MNFGRRFDLHCGVLVCRPGDRLEAYPTLALALSRSVGEFAVKSKRMAYLTRCKRRQKTNVG
jgi:hypothetical protein